MIDDFEKFLDEQLNKEEKEIDAAIAANEIIRNTHASPALRERIMQEIDRLTKEYKQTDNS